MTDRSARPQTAAQVALGTAISEVTTYAHGVVVRVRHAAQPQRLSHNVAHDP